MSGLGLVMNIAKSALAAQQYGMDVTAHNIANAGTPGYSRQTAVQEAKKGEAYGGMLLGRGVDTSQVVRTTDQFIEDRLMQEKSGLSHAREMENYMKTLEGMFNENPEGGMSQMLAEFWSKWHDIANNPSGASERIALYEHSAILTKRFNSMSADLGQLETDVTNAMVAGIREINQISEKIAKLNGQIIGSEAGGVANDLRDKRNELVSDLSECIDVKSFEQDNGSLTVISARGCILVQGNDKYDIKLGGDNGDRVKWQGSGGESLDITNYITKGKMGGRLEMRDEVIAKYKLDLDAVARGFIWAVNEQHSQGVGLKFFDKDVTGTYMADPSGLLSTLAYGHNIDYSKDLRMWIDDGGGPTAVTVDMGKSTASVTDWGTNFAAGSTKYTITVTQAGDISDGDGATKVKWKKGSGAWSGDVDVNADGTLTIDGNTIKFDPTGQLVAGNTLTVNTKADGTADKLDLSASGTANRVLNSYIFKVTTGGTIGTDAPVITWSNGVTSGTISITSSGNYSVDGMALNFVSGTLAEGDSFTITADSDGTPTTGCPSDWHWTLESFKDEFNTQASGLGVTASLTSSNALKFSPAGGTSFGFCDDEFNDCGLLAALGINAFFKGDGAGSIDLTPEIADKDYIAGGKIDGDTGDYAVGDNTNAMDIAGLQYSSFDMTEWTCDRINGNREAGITTTIEDSYHSMLSSIGIISSSISRNTSFEEIMVNQLGEMRDSISAVSLDEEMTNLIEYQHAFAAAAKLITVSDEMMKTLLEAK